MAGRESDPGVFLKNSGESEFPSCLASPGSSGKAKALASYRLTTSCARDQRDALEKVVLIVLVFNFSPS